MLKNGKIAKDGRIEVLGLLSVVLPGPWMWHAGDLNEQNITGVLFRCFEEGNDGEIAPGPWIWHAEDLDEQNITGVIFRCYEQGSERELAHLLMGDITIDPDEPDITSLTPEGVSDFDKFLERETRNFMVRDGGRVIKWMSSHLNETQQQKRLVTAYIAEEGGASRQYIVVRTHVRGRKVAVVGCFTVNRSKQLANLVFPALQEVLAGPVFASFQNVLTVPPSEAVSALPTCVSGFARGEVTDYECQTPGFGYGVEYKGSSRATVTVYVYDFGIAGIPDGPLNAMVRKAFDQAAQEVLASKDSLGRRKIEVVDRYVTGSPSVGAQFLCGEFSIQMQSGDERRSYLYLTGYNGNFLKIRVTLYTNDVYDATAREFADAMASELWPSLLHSRVLH